MDFFQATASCFKKYAEFNGRAQRSEYWYFVLFCVGVGFGMGALDIMLFPAYENGPLGTVFSLATIIPSLAVGARRLHDIGKSAWWLLLWLAIVVGWIVLILWAIQEGDRGPNDYGADPVSNSTRDDAAY